MSLVALGTAANILGVVTPAKDVGDVIKAIANSVEDVKRDEESVSFWEKTLKEYAKTLCSLIIRCQEGGNSDYQIGSLKALLEALVRFLEEVIEIGQKTYLQRWYASRDIKQKIRIVERRVKHCQDVFVTDTLAMHSAMLASIERRQIGAIADRDGRSRILERMTIRWKIPGNADRSNSMAVDYTYLAKKANALVHVFYLNATRIEDLLFQSKREIKSLSYGPDRNPEGCPMKKCEDASAEAVRLSRVLQNHDWDSMSFPRWLDDFERLTGSLYNVGLKKEARVMREVTCRIWTSLASHAGSASIYSRLADSLFNLAVYYTNEGCTRKALSLVEKAIEVYRNLGESAFLNLAMCLRIRSACVPSPLDALESVQESVRMLRKLADDDFGFGGAELLKSLSRQAYTYNILMRYEDALLSSSEAVQRFSRISPQMYPVGYVQIYWNNAESYRGIGDHERAKDFRKKAVTAYHQLIYDHPLFYIYSLGYTAIYSHPLSLEEALPVIDESLTVCLTIDSTFTAPEFANILVLRARKLISKNRYREALESIDRAVDIWRHLDENSEDGDRMHSIMLWETFRNRALCQLSLGQQYNAAISLDAAQDAIVSYMKNETNNFFEELIIEELKKEGELLDKLTSQECVDLLSSLKSYKKIFSAIDELKRGN